MDVQNTPYPHPLSKWAWYVYRPSQVLISSFVAWVKHCFASVDKRWSNLCCLSKADILAFILHLIILTSNPFKTKFEFSRELNATQIRLYKTTSSLMLGRKFLYKVKAAFRWNFCNCCWGDCVLNVMMITKTLQT